MIYPNIDCYFLCLWMLNASSQRLTGPQTVVTEAIRDAALNNTSVTETEWNNFNLFAAWRNPYYLVYRDYQLADTSSLLTGIIHYYSMNGNSNDSVGSLNGTDTSITYNAAYGKINQGARNSLGTSSIAIGAVSDFSFIQNTGIFSINGWARLTGLSSSYVFLASTGTSAAKGFYSAYNSTTAFAWSLFNASSNPSGLLNLSLTRIFSDLNYHMITFAGDGTYYYVYLDSVLISKGLFGTFASGDSTGILNFFRIPGSSGSNTMDMSEWGFWDRKLSLPEISQLYNGGSGITYPF